MANLSKLEPKPPAVDPHPLPAAAKQNVIVPHPIPVGAPRFDRSLQWPAVARAHLANQSMCVACGKNARPEHGVQVHHLFPFHDCISLGRPALELDPRNLITLCESEAGRPAANHHLLLGHLDNFQSANLNVAIEAAHTFFEMTAEQIRKSRAYRARVKRRVKALDAMNDAEKRAFRAWVAAASRARRPAVRALEGLRVTPPRACHNIAYSRLSIHSRNRLMSSCRPCWVGLALVVLAGCSGSSGASSSSSTSGSTSSGSTASSTPSSGSSGSSTGATASSSNTGGSSTGSGSTGGASTASSASGTSGGSSNGSATATNGSSSTGGSATTGAGSTGGGTTGTTGFHSTLLVQNDGNTPPNDPSDSTPLPLFQAWLGSFAPSYSLYQVPEDGSDLLSPTALMLAPVSTAVWFTGDNSGSPDGTIDADQETALLSWLDTGNKTLLIFSTGLITDLGNNRPYDGSDGPETDRLISLLAVQDNSYPELYSGPDSIEGGLNAETSVVVTGGADAAFTGKGWTVVNGYAFDTYGGDGVNFEWNGLAPAPGSDVLATVQADADLTFSANQPMPVVLGRKHVGAAGTSTVVLVVFPLENIKSGLSGANSDTLQAFLAAVQAYAGL